jgi:glycerol-3-phosphate dehydrogenase (NAD(P)+)
MKKVVVVGLGNFGYAVLKHLDTEYTYKRYTLTGFTRNPEVISSLQADGTHPFVSAPAPLSKQVRVVSDLQQAVSDADHIILSVSSNAIADIITKMRHFITKPATIINTAKALDHRTGEPFSRVVEGILFEQKVMYSVIVGATIAADLLQNVPLGMNVASRDKKTLTEVASLFSSRNLRLFPTTDLIGVEYASAFKNVLSIFSGLVKGLGYSLETEIFAVTQMAAEVERLVVGQFGGTHETFALSSPCWGNDIWMSCTSKTRNRELGLILGTGKPVQEVLIEMEVQKKTTEGVFTIQVLNKLTDLTQYPLLSFMFNFFEGTARLDTISSLIENRKVARQ